MIRKLPNKKVWVLKSKSGKKELGRFKSLKSAKKREQQIQYFKRKKS